MPRLGDLAACGLATASFVACAQISGLDGYATDEQADARAIMAGQGATDADTGRSDGAGSEGASSDGHGGADATGATLDGAPIGSETSVPGSFACLRGGCNSSTGTCAGPGSCLCAADSDCKAGKCVSVPGRNDVSCGSACTGSGMTDGFGCELSCASDHFNYLPSNFDPGHYTPPSNATTDCTATYDSTAHAFTSGSCAGQTPVVAANVTQTGGHGNADILVFKSLMIEGTLTLAGSNPVILAVYGDAKIRGTIDASAKGTTPGPGGNECAAVNNGSNTPDNVWESGASGGGQAGPGGLGGPSRGSQQGVAGSAQGTGPLPLNGGCAGGVPYVGANLNYSPPAGAGGGAVQISAAGVVDLTSGTIDANGSRGGSGEPGKCQNGYPAQNGTGGAGGGSGGAIVVEGGSISGGMLIATGGSGGAGGPAPSPNSQAGGEGGLGGIAGAPGKPGASGVQIGTSPPDCNGAGTWSGGGGGGGGGGYVETNVRSCLCARDSDCSSGLCSNASQQCVGTCTGATSAGTYDSVNCQYVVAASTR